MECLFVMDPIEQIDPYKDTTLVMMLAAAKRGHNVHCCRIEDLWLDGSVANATVWPTTVRRSMGDHYTLEPPINRPLDDFSIVFMRKDPPVDIDYIHATYLLDRAPASTLVVNSPKALRGCNEKLFALEFPELVPPTVVTSNIPRLLDFCDRQGGRMVLKPVDGRGGEGIFIVSRDDPNHRTILETLTSFGRRRALAQRYLPEIMESGDKRVIVVNGEPLGAVMRQPGTGDFRSNVHSGGKVAPCALDDHDRKIAATLGDQLRARGIVFAGLDVIGGYLTEINITSPTLIQEIAEFTGWHLEEEIIDAAVDACLTAGSGVR